MHLFQLSASVAHVTAHISLMSQACSSVPATSLALVAFFTRRKLLCLMGSLSPLDVPKLHHGRIRHVSNALHLKAAAGAEDDSPHAVWHHQVQLLLPCHMG